MDGIDAEKHWRSKYHVIAKRLYGVHCSIVQGVSKRESSALYKPVRIRIVEITVAYHVDSIG
jgi:hypothetical protein